MLSFKVCFIREEYEGEGKKEKERKRESETKRKKLSEHTPFSVVLRVTSSNTTLQTISIGDEYR